MKMMSRIHSTGRGVFVDDEFYPMPLFGYTDRPVGYRLQGGDGWLTNATVKPSGKDVVYPPETVKMTDDGLVYFPMLTFDIVDIETSRLGGDIEMVGYGGSLFDFDGATMPLMAFTDEVVAEATSDDDKPSTEATADDDKDPVKATAKWLADNPPSVMVGYNFYDYDLPLLFADLWSDLAKRWHVRREKTTYRYGMDTKRVPVYYGLADFIDLYLSVLRYDVETGGKLEGYSLKTVAEAFGFHRTTGDWFEGRSDLKTYLMDDIMQTYGVASVLLPPLLAQSYLLPFRLTDQLVKGTGTKIDTLLAMAYRRAGYGVPKPPAPVSKPYKGAYVEANAGVYRGRVVKFDFVSMYPSIIVYEQLRPKQDVLDMFVPLIRTLRDKRIEWKREGYDVLQSAMKIIINSAYGFHGSSRPFPFSDRRIAEAITAKGRELVSKLKDLLAQYGDICNVDTDGVVVALRDDVDLDALTAEVRSAFEPYQLDVEVYDTALVIKMKNYVLFRGDKPVVIKGNSLRSRKDEPIVRSLIQTLLKAITDGQLKDADDLEAVVIDVIRGLVNDPSVDKLTQRYRVGKFLRQHRPELVEDKEDGEKVDMVKTIGGWSLADVLEAPIDLPFYITKIITAVGRLGGWFEDWSNRHRKKAVLQALMDKHNIDIAITAKRAKEKAKALPL